MDASVASANTESSLVASGNMLPTSVDHNCSGVWKHSNAHCNCSNSLCLSSISVRVLLYGINLISSSRGLQLGYSAGILARPILNDIKLAESLYCQH